MEQIKYIFYSILILIGGSLTYSVMKPVFFSDWAASSTSATATASAPAKAVTIKNIAGKNLFSSNCQSCHAVSKDLTGPALAGVEERGPWTDRKNLVKWVQNPAVFLPTTKYTSDLAVQYNGQVMPSFPQLSETDIHQIFDYIKEASGEGK